MGLYNNNILIIVPTDAVSVFNISNLRLHNFSP